MVEAATISLLNYFMPVFSFLFVFVLVYALLAKTKILGENNFVHLLISFLLASFFIVNASLVKFVNFSSAWFVVFIICIFMIMLLIAFTHGKVDVIMKPGVAWFLLIGLIVFFIVSASYTFNLALNWANLTEWAQTDWFGMLLLVGIALVVSFVLTKK
ncbi:MAG: hypothetical protein Q7S33_05115 [Nanoarchaeota archaeon]|nr:hypothetical protein [Nanoarchaeota archaeon]